MVNVYLNIGSNIEKHQNIRSGINALEQEFGNLQLSSVYESEPVGFKGDTFFNLAAFITTDVPLKQLSEKLKNIEDRHGRNREDKNFKGRTLDIDIVLYGDVEGTLDGIELPRPELYYHGFVLRPMAELAGDLVDIKTGLSYSVLWEASKEKINQDLNKVSL